MSRDVLKPVALLVVLLAITIALGVSFGATRIAWDDDTARTILLRIRLPRVLLAAAIGATLAVAGVTFQTLLRNALADPFILGVSGGAITPIPRACCSRDWCSTRSSRPSS